MSPACLGKVLFRSDHLGQLCTYSIRFSIYPGICDCNETAAHDDHDDGGGDDGDLYIIGAVCVSQKS